MAGHLFGGFNQALDRFDLAVREPDAEPCFIALFETLNWCVAIDDYVGQVWAPDGTLLEWEWRERAGGSELADLLNAARYARNLVHHHWADALLNDEGRGYPRRYTAGYFTWRWREADELPVHVHEEKPYVVRNKKAYGKRFAGDQADASLQDIAEGLKLVELVLAVPQDARAHD